MELSAMKALLDSQERAYRSALDIVTEQFKQRISSLENTVSDLTKSLQFTQAEVVDLQNEIRALKKSDSEYKARNSYWML